MAENTDNSAPETNTEDNNKELNNETKIQVNRGPVSKPLPKLPAEEDDLIAASANIDDDIKDSQPAHQAVVGMQPKKSKKKLIIIIIVLLLIAGAAAAVYFLVLNKPKTTSKPGQTNATDSAPAVETKNSYLPENIAYAFKAKESDPYSVYYRPAAGGERKEALKLDAGKVVLDNDAQGPIVAFIADNVLYASTDSGKTYTKIYEKTGSEELISVRISFDFKRIGLSVLPEFGTATKTKVYSLDLNGKDKKTIAESDKAILLIGWNSDKNKVVYSTGCYACDGARDGYKITDFKENKTQDIVKNLNVKTFNYSVAVSTDMSKFVYSTGLEDNVSEGLGVTTLAPYVIKSVDLNSLAETTLATIGTKDEKNSNGTVKKRDIKLGFLTGSSTPFYIDGLTLNKLDAGKSSLIYQSDKNILDVDYVSDKNIIVSTGGATSDFLLSNYSLSDKKSTQIFSGDNNTLILGVTTK